jgi:hypothetical protein
MKQREDTPLARAFLQVLEQPERARSTGTGSETLVTLLIVALALLLVVLAVRLGVQPMMDATERLAMATEKRRVQDAVESYLVLDQLPAIPARGAPRRILPGDADAPFARFLRGVSRYPYRWFEDGRGLHAVGGEPPEAGGVLAVAALAHDLLQTHNAPQGDPALWGDWQEQLQLCLRQHIEHGDALGLANPVSGGTDIRRLAGPALTQEGPPAVLISDAPIHTYRYLSQQPTADLSGSIVVASQGAAGEAEVFWVSPEGRPLYLLIAGGSRALPRRARAGW